jgi:hypothetical protein
MFVPNTGRRTIRSLGVIAASAGLLLLTPTTVVAAPKPTPPHSLTDVADWSTQAVATNDTTGVVTTYTVGAANTEGQRTETVTVDDGGKVTVVSSTVTGLDPTITGNADATTALQALDANAATPADAPSGSGGNPSASGGMTVSVTTMDCEWSWCSDYIFEGQQQFCWGGGVPGVHWGRVYRCGYAWDSNTDPATSQWFPQLNAYMTPPQIGASIALLAWANMDYSADTEFEFHTWASTSVVENDVTVWSHPSVWITSFANGTYTWS